MPLLELTNLTHRFGRLTALESLNLSVEKGEVISLLGPSGCGKTTTIRLIAGFLVPTSGDIRVQGRDLAGLPPEKRNMGMVFQSYAIFPHLNVFENVAFGLKARRVAPSRIRDKVTEMMSLVGLSGYEHRPVFELSGGEQQRVAIARTLAPEPEILLLDEPLSNLDASLREQTRKQLRQLITRLGITALYVTHDQEEAFALSDRIALLNKGVCQQVGTAQDLYYRPANEFVAQFIGRSNVFSLPFLGRGEDCLIFELPSGTPLRLKSTEQRALQPGTRVSLVIRPEDLFLEPHRDRIRLARATVTNRRFSGASCELELDGEGLHWLVTQPGRRADGNLQPGVVADLHASPDAFVMLP
ncbi:MAG: ABC transporter ATP-binding protein [Acidobacteriota bacterium]